MYDLSPSFSLETSSVKEFQVTHKTRSSWCNGCRFEIKLPYGEAPFNDSAIVDDELMLSLTKRLLLNGAVTLDTFSAVDSRKQREPHMHI